MNNKLLLAVLVAGMPIAAHATNWLQIQGSEASDSGHFKPFGFLQPTYTYIDADPIAGLAGAAAVHNGKDIVPNLVGPDLDKNDTDRFQFNRARIGMRGNIIPGKINYFLLAEAGRNAITAQRDVMMTDASISFHYIPGARIRAGLFKVPTGEEALVAVHTSFPYVYFSNVSTSLLIEQPVRSTSAVSGTGTASASVVSGGSGFRDWGVQVYDWFNKDAWEFSYALMVSNGNEIEEMGDDDGNLDVTGRLQVSYVFNKSKGPNREDVSVYAWHQNGEREFGNTDYDRIRQGAGFKYLKGPYRVSGEYMQGDGMIVAGPNPPFVGQPTQVGVTEEADGWYLEAGWRFLKDWEIDLRHDQYNRMTKYALNEREFTSTTLGLQWFFYKNTRLTLNYEWRDLEVVNPAAIAAGAARDNAVAIAKNMGDRISLQLTWFF
jgi:hypothetical protein